MKKIIICILFLISQNTLMSQLVLNLWNENLVLKKENPIWMERTTQTIEIKNGKQIVHPKSKVKIDKEGNQKIIQFDMEGKVEEVTEIKWKDEFTEIYESDGVKEIRKYNENGDLVADFWTFSDGSKEEKTFTYEDNKLVKIVSIDEDGIAMEELKYKDDKLSQILSVTERGKVLMERKIIYDKEGKIVEKQRIQEDEINKRVIYTYDDNNRLIHKEEEKINRLFGGMMPPEIYEYLYHDNGVLKEEKWIIYKDESRAEIKHESITSYNELGLEIEGMLIEPLKHYKEISTYTYKLKE